MRNIELLKSAVISDSFRGRVRCLLQAVNLDPDGYQGSL